MALFASKKKTQMPGHVCFVPDAGALAAQAAVSAELQAQGAQRLCELLQTCSQYEIPHVSVLLGAFNGDYPQEMLRQFLRTHSDFLQEQQVRVLVTEPLAEVDAELQSLLLGLQADTAANTGTRLAIVPCADGRAAILHAVASWQRDAHAQAGQGLTEETLSRYMPFGQFPDPDLLIRTGCGVGRSLALENTLLWQAAYTELYFCEAGWQDFGVQGLEEALGWFGRRERRFGGVMGA